MRNPTWLTVVAAMAAATPAAPATSAGATAPRIERTRLPVHFEPNRGQAADGVRWIARGPDGPLLVGDDAIRVGGSGRLTLGFAGARPGSFEPIEALPGKSHYYRGSDRKQWLTGVPHYGALRRADVWPCVDLVLREAGGELEYDLVLAPGSDPAAIRLEFGGADALAIDQGGNLVIEIGGERLVQRAPRLYQEAAGRRTEIAGRFLVHGPEQVGFDVTGHDPSQVLVIDPVLRYSTYHGGLGQDGVAGLAVGPGGEATIAGTTSSPEIQPGGTDPASGMNVFVARLDATGSRLLWSSFLIGSATDWAVDVVLDAQGNACVLGSTWSGDFPVTAGVLQPALGGSSDLFVASFDGSGQLVASTYLGGNGLEGGERGQPTQGGSGGGGIAVDGAGHVYVGSSTQSANYPVTAALQPLPGGQGDAVVSKLTPSLSGLVWSTYLGGSAWDYATDIAADAAGAVVVVGSTRSADFPSANPLQPLQGAEDAFVTWIEPGGVRLAWSTWFGGSTTLPGGWSTDEATAVALDPAGNPVVVGTTGSVDFPLSGAAQSTLGGGQDAYIARFSRSGHILLSSTYLGGASNELAMAVAVDSLGRAHVTGTTLSSDFPQVDPLGPPLGGSQDLFVTTLAAAGDRFEMSTYLGGEGYDVEAVLALDPPGNVHVAGATYSSASFPITPGALQTIHGGSQDAFVTAFADAGPALLRLAPERGGQGVVTVLVRKWGGAAFEPGAIVRLVRSGEADVVASAVEVAQPGWSLYARLPLATAALGAWDVVITNPGGAVSTMPAAFTVEPLRDGPPWVDLIGPAVFRTGFATTFALRYGTRGNVDAFAVPVWLLGIPGDVAARVSSPLTDPPLLPGQGTLDWTGFADIVGTGGAQVASFLVPRVSPGVSGQVMIELTVPSDRTFTVRAEVQAPFLGPPMTGAALDCWSATTRVEAGAALADLLGGALTPACDAAIPVRVEQHFGDLVGRGGVAPDLASPLFPLARTLALLINDTGACADPAFAAFPPTALAAYVAHGIVALGDAASGLPECGELGVAASRERRLETRRAVDPNLKVGAEGAGAPRWIAGDEPLRWVVHFENLASAGLPAQEVVVEDVLDAATLDLTTLQIASFGLAGHEVAVEPGLNPLAGEIDLRPGNGLVARVDARLDEASGVLRFRLRSIDPATGRATTDPLAGVLPPNLAPPEGQGHLSLTVRARPGLPTGTAVRNSAAIVFDANPPLVTPEWLNTLDNDRPESAVESLTGVVACSFPVRWGGSDVGSGIADYTVLVSVDGGAWTVWQEATTATSATFTAAPGSTYAFASQARDAVGHRELVTGLADTSIFVDPAWVAAPADAGNTLRVVRRSGGVEVSWQSIPGASDYLVFADTDPAGSFAGEDGSGAATSLLLGLPGDARLWRAAGRSPCGTVGPR